jgi:hypothetical protein
MMQQHIYVTDSKHISHTSKFNTKYEVYTKLLLISSDSVGKIKQPVNKKTGSHCLHKVDLERGTKMVGRG